jgi:hypothetical protein
VCRGLACPYATSENSSLSPPPDLLYLQYNSQVLLYDGSRRPPARPSPPRARRARSFCIKIYDTNFSERQAGTVLYRTVNYKKSDHVVAQVSEFGRKGPGLVYRAEWGNVTAATIESTTTTGPSPPGIQGTPAPSASRAPFGVRVFAGSSLSSTRCFRVSACQGTIVDGEAQGRAAISI